MPLRKIIRKILLKILIEISGILVIKIINEIIKFNFPNDNRACSSRAKKKKNSKPDLPLASP